MINNVQRNFHQAEDKPSSQRNLSSSHQNTSKGAAIEYYEEYCKVLMANAILNAQYKEIKNERDALFEKFERLQEQGGGGYDSIESRKERSNPECARDKLPHKRERRTAVEITRDHKCPVETCGKAYGTDTALNHHIRLKHPEIKK